MSNVPAIYYYALGFLVGNGQLVFSNPATTYDQRQTGDINVQIHVKDLQVVALVDPDLLEDYTDYDYAYDYADFTLKPIVKPTTSSPSVSSSSVKPWNTWPTKPSTSPTTTMANQLIEDSASMSNATNDSQNNNNTVIPQTNNGTTIKSRINDKAGQLFDSEDIVQIESVQDEKKVVSLTTSGPGLKKLCPAGYVLNKKGRCYSSKNHRRFSLVPFTMRLASKLSDKGRLNTRKDLPIRIYKSEPRVQ